tara:strand:+ start:5327 stop:5872 length:546 start_codon:yes stop_codon:yes gene_type:complete
MPQLSLANNLTQQDEGTKGTQVLIAEPFASDSSIGALGVGEDDWTEGTGCTVDHTSGFATVASDGTANRYASFTVTVTPNTTYNYEYKLTSVTNLSNSATEGTVKIMFGTEANNDTYGVNTHTTAGAAITELGTFSIGDITTLHITIKVVTASRKAWIDYWQTWEGLIGVTRAPASSMSII